MPAISSILAGTAIAGVIGSTVVGGISAGKSADAQVQSTQNASQAQLQAQREANELQWKMYSQSRADQLPWLQKGEWGLNMLQETIRKGPGKFETSPGYQFRLQEGEKAILRNAAATGGVASGRTLKALTRFGQETATSDYDNFLNRYYDRLKPLQSLAGVGQTMAGQSASNALATGTNLSNIAMNTGQGLAQNALNLGSARASGYINQANAMNAGVGNMINLASLYRQPTTNWTPQMVTGNSLPAGSYVETGYSPFGA